MRDHVGTAASKTHTRPGWLASTYPYVIAGLLCAAFLCYILHLWGADLHIPLDPPANDYLVEAVMVKNILETGWYWTSPRLAAPFGFQLYDFPSAEGFHTLIIKAIGLFTSDCVLVANLFYLLGYLLACLAALYVFRQLRLPSFPAIGMSLLFAFLPHHYLRAEYHLFLSAYYLVPFAILLLLWLATGEPLIVRSATARVGFIITRKGTAAIVLSVLSGSGGVYYAFFTAFLLVVTAIALWTRSRQFSNIVPPLVALAVLGVSVLGNLAPAITYHMQHGTNHMVADRSPSEAEIYGLRIIHLLLPVPGHRVPFLAAWRSRVAAMSPDCEGVESTRMASLGLIGSAGFLSLIAIALWRPVGVHSSPLNALSTWNLAAVLLASVGGFGSVFAWTISSSIRAYTRISVFIAFFSFAALLMLAQRFQVSRLRSAVAARTYYSIVGVLSLAGLWDLTPVRVDPAPGYQHSVATRAFVSDWKFVQTMEASLPKGAMVLQLPYLAFPEAPFINRLGSYDHFRGYLYSRYLRWSFGAMRGRDSDRWERNISGGPLSEMLPAVRQAGFGAIYIDRFGFRDNGAYLCERLSAVLGHAPIESGDHRLAFFTLLSGTSASTVAPEYRAEPTPESAESGPTPAASPVLTDFRQRIAAPAPPARMTPGQSYLLSGVRVTNTGRQVWPARGETPVEFTYNWLTPQGTLIQHGGVTLLTADLAPGQTRSLEPLIIAPEQPGQYVIRFTMIAEKIAWFSDMGGAVVEYKISVVPQ